MPFGLIITPRTFTKLSAVLLAQLREMEILCFIYLDNWLVAAMSQEESVAHTEIVQRVLTNAGILSNQGKSTQVPTQSIECLGWTWDTCSLQLIFPAEKVKSLVGRVKSFLGGEFFTCRSLENLVGYLNWVVAVDKVGRVHLKAVNSFQTSLGRRYTRDQEIPMCQELISLL